MRDKMADESFLELDEFDSSTISVFVKLQAYVRGFLVRKLLNEIRLEYEDIVKDVEKDSEVVWPARFSVPVVRKCSKHRKQEQCQGRERHGLSRHQNQADVSVKLIPHSEEDVKTTRFKNVDVESDYSINVKDRRRVVLDSNRKKGKRATNYCSPLTFPANNPHAINASNDDSRDNKDKLRQSKQVDRKATRFGGGVEHWGESSIDDQNTNNNREDFMLGGIPEIQNESGALDAKVISVADQGIQIDLVADPLMNASSDIIEVSSIGSVSKQIQVKESDIAAGSGNLATTSFISDVVENSCDSDDSKSRVSADGKVSRRSSQSVVGDVIVTNEEETPGDLGLEHSSGGDYGLTLKTYDASGEVVVGLDSVQNAHSSSEILDDKSTSPTHSYTDDNVTPVISDEDRQVVGLLSDDDDDNGALDVGLQGSSSHPVSDAEGVNPALPCDGNGIEGRGNLITSPDLPDDKKSLLELKKTLTMELLWIQQAINSRKHYLHLKQQLA